MFNFLGMNLLLENSGSNHTTPNDFNGVDWGKYNPVPSYNFQSYQDRMDLINNFYMNINK